MRLSIIWNGISVSPQPLALAFASRLPYAWSDMSSRRMKASSGEPDEERVSTVGRNHAAICFAKSSATCCFDCRCAIDTKT
jgi:hypothetical protein